MKMFKKAFRILASAMLTAAVAFAPIAGVTASASSVSAAQEAVASGAHRCNVDKPGEGYSFVQIEGNFTQTPVEEIINLINSYRLEACENGYPKPWNPSMPLTMADYHPIKWSRELQETAMLRAAEASLTGYHFSLVNTGVSYDFNMWNRSYGMGYGNENLAYTSSLLNAVRMWYSERDAWVNQTSAQTGHYTALINPNHEYCGLASFNSTSAGVFSSGTYSTVTGHEIDQTCIDTSVYDSQIAVIRNDSIQAVNITCEDNEFLVGESSILKARGVLSIYAYLGGAWSNVGFKQISGIPIIADEWGSDNPEIVSVDSLGNVTAVALGSAQVYCVIAGMRYTGTVNVVEPALVVTPSSTPIPSANPAPSSSSVSSSVVAPTSSAPAAPSFTSSEPGVAGFVDRLYGVALGRTADPVGRAYWINRATNGSATGADLARGFLYSPEFLGKNTSNEVFLTTLYSTFFNRTPDSTGRAYWLNRMANGMNRQEVINGFINSIEWDDLCVSYDIESGSGAAANRSSRSVAR